MGHHRLLPEPGREYHWQLALPDFPCHRRSILLFQGDPILRVEQISFLDAHDTLRVLDSTWYWVSLNDPFPHSARIYLGVDVWPPVAGRPESVWIDYVTLRPAPPALPASAPMQEGDLYGRT